MLFYMDPGPTFIFIEPYRYLPVPSIKKKSEKSIFLLKLSYSFFGLTYKVIFKYLEQNFLFATAVP